LFNSGEKIVEVSKMGVCMVSPLFHPSVGGPGRQAVAFVEKYFSKGSSIFVFCRKMSGLPSYDYNPNIKVYKLRTFYPQIHNLEEISFKNILISLSFSTSLIISLIRRRKEYDLIHFFGAGLPLILSVLFLKIMGKKITATVLAANLGNEAGSLRNRYFPLGLLMTNVLKKVDFFIAMTEEIENALLDDGFNKDRIRRIPNWVDANKFYPIGQANKISSRKRLGLEKSITVLFVGRLVYTKGTDLLIKAWKEVILDNPSCVLLIAGTGIEQSELESLCKNSGIEENVLFLGHINNVEEYLKVVDVFVFPSRHEGMPNALLEAMACGLPVIASRIGGVVDVVEDGRSGILFEPGDVSGLTSAMIKLLKDDDLRQKLGAEARKRIVEGFSIERAADEYIKLYGKLIAQS